MCNDLNKCEDMDNGDGVLEILTQIIIVYLLFIQQF